MCTKPMPQQHFSSRCPRNTCHSNVSLADVNETNATTTFLKSLSTKHMSQQHFSSRCLRNLDHVNISRFERAAKRPHARIEKCCCVESFVDIGWRNVAVARVSWTLTGEMLLCERLRAHRLEKCCCGNGFMDIGLRNVAVACVSCTSANEMLLWHWFCGHRLGKCCCGSGFVHIG